MAPPGEIHVTTLERLVKEHGITSLFLTTALFNLVAEEQPRCLAGVCEVWIGGERASSLAIQQMWDACPLVTVMNGLVRRQPHSSLIINRAAHGQHGPLASHGHATRPRRSMRKVAPGIHGELYTEQRPRSGWAWAPGADSGRFVTNPFGPPGSRMYAREIAAWDGL